MQLHHNQSKFLKKQHNLILICDAVNSPANVGSIFRLADAFGVQKIIFGTNNIDLNSSRLKRTARSTQNWVKMEDAVNLENFIPKLKEEGYEIMALEITENSTSIDAFNFSKLKNVALIVGEENVGVSKNILQLCNQQIHINMFGNNSSMNVAQATAIALYEITKQLNN